jgi:hypothetical protein
MVELRWNYLTILSWIAVSAMAYLLMTIMPIFFSWMALNNVINKAIEDFT